MDIIKYKYIFIGLAVLLALLSIASIAVFGFKQGIDFAGGTLWQIKFQENNINLDDFSRFFIDQNIEGVLTRPGVTNQDFSIRMNEITEMRHQEIALAIKDKFGNFEESSFASIGPAIGAELRNNALNAFFLVLLGISFYVAFAFRKVSYPVSSWKYGLATLISLFHDAIIPAGIFSVLSYYKGIEIDTNFIVAILVIMGFSVHDTIVVFDRIRENLLLAKNKLNLGDIINASVKQTFVRSVNTSLTLVLVLVFLYVFGAPSLSYFTLLILIGTIIGTYSSIFVASPLLTLLK